MKQVAIACLMAGLLAGGVAAEGQSPEEIIVATADAVDARLTGRQAYLEENPDELFAIVDEVLLPHFDREYAARLVLARNWRRATPEQRSRFIDVFYNFLLRNYANGILKFNRDSLTVLPERGGSPPGKARVATEMSLDDGTRVPVDYFFREVDSQWRVFDIKIEGISYVVNYRNQFATEIKTKGLDAVIARLEGASGDSEEPTET